MIALGRRVYGLGAIVLGLAGLIWDDFALVWQPVPADTPHRAALAYAVGALLVLGGAAINWRRTTELGAGLLTALFLACVVLLHLPRIFAHPLSITPWGGAAEQLALAASGLIAFTTSAKTRAIGLAQLALRAFAVCLLIFGLVHFLYLDATAAMVPAYIPPNRTFWAAATGIFDIAAGVAILTGNRARLAATLLTVMFALFSALIHIPALLAAPHSHMGWVMNGMNLALIGAAWIAAESLGRGR